MKTVEEAMRPLKLTGWHSTYDCICGKQMRIVSGEKPVEPHQWCCSRCGASFVPKAWRFGEE